uniref:Pyrroline-5-carboxylate reductase n=2 Tax=Lotharella globosa TaxID=91324 RepID=A0A6V3K1Q8_9EUKA|mmetsp:Transcript_6518/g.12254  ORF Transcript_6518/g.12254 Transcript_6518/m.12254 type:complete len:278 (+) Transcript_6518:28-861(+)
MPRVGFIGAGQMATAMARGIVKSKLYPAADIIASDRSKEQRESFAKLVGCSTTEDNKAVAKGSETLILAVKPNIVPYVLAEVKGCLTSSTLVVSIAAGVSLATMEELLPTGTRLARVMPNTPCLVGETASAYALGKNATKDDGKTVEQILQACGKTCRVQEKLLDAVTGLSGSGPAYVYILIEAMADGGVRMGLPRPVALQLAAQTVLGSAKMVMETGEHPGLLKDKVASPGGTTIAGIHALEKGGFRATVMNAVEAAATRSRELSKAAESKSSSKL